MSVGMGNPCDKDDLNFLYASSALLWIMTQKHLFRTLYGFFVFLVARLRILLPSFAGVFKETLKVTGST